MEIILLFTRVKGQCNLVPLKSEQIKWENDMNEMLFLCYSDVCHNMDEEDIILSGKKCSPKKTATV